MSFPKPGKAAPLHPFCEIFPPMDGESFKAFKESLAKHGQKEDIVLLDGKVLDGANRQKGLLELGEQPRYREYDYRKDGKSPLQFVAAKNLYRRDLSASQKAAIAVEIAEKLVAETTVKVPASAPAKPTNVVPMKPASAPSKAAGAGIVDPGVISEGEAMKTAAKATGAAERTAQRAKRVKEADPKLHEQVKKGEVSVDAAEKKITAAQRKQREFEQAVQRIQEVCGKHLADGVRDGSRLKKKGECVAFASLENERMLELRHLIENGWTLRDAEKYKFNSITQGHRVRDLLERAQAQGSMYILEIAGWEIQCKRLEKK